MQNRTRNFLIGLTLNEMQSILAEAGYTHKSPALLAHHVYKKTGKEIHDIHAYPLKLREYLSARYTSAPAQPLQSMLSSDGSAKYLFCNHEGLYYETVRMPEERRETVCISSQSGCRYGCRFCNTGKTGFLGDLDSYEILSQVSGTGPLPSHVVFMGMGEPL